jgi:hypothetical protein
MTTPTSSFAMPARIVKNDATRQIAYGVVLEPRTADNPDTQGDWYTADDIERAAHGFLETVAKGDGGADLMHLEGGEGPLIGYPVESFIAPVDFTWGSGDRLEVVKAGSWVMGVHYPDPAIWAAVAKGELGAFSVFGSGKRVIG